MLCSYQPTVLMAYQDLHRQPVYFVHQQHPSYQQQKQLVYLLQGITRQYRRHQVIIRPDLLWKMRVITVYDDDREEIIIYVSTYDMQGQSIKANKDRMK